ncbi:MAG: type II toxin-antitoxin system antitoxin, RelB/DinJ family [Ruminococcus sp.]|nr:type II toxin-antitoxin system antitoxin, RelB/DinJ family [Ruminococcus sp.]
MHIRAGIQAVHCRRQFKAFNIFVRQSLREGRIPFDISLNQPNSETVAAMLEAERIAKDPSVKGYTDLDELFTDLKA